MSGGVVPRGGRADVRAYTVAWAGYVAAMVTAACEARGVSVEVATARAGQPPRMARFTREAPERLTLAWIGAVCDGIGVDPWLLTAAAFELAGEAPTMGAAR